MVKQLLQNGNDYCWHTVYSRLFHEKKVESLPKEKSMEVALPKRTILKKWSDRKKCIEEPLIRSYIFVYVNRKEYYQLLQVPSVIHYVCFNGKESVIPYNQTGMLKKISEKFN